MTFDGIGFPRQPGREACSLVSVRACLPLDMRVGFGKVGGLGQNGGDSPVPRLWKIVWNV